MAVPVTVAVVMPVVMFAVGAVHMRSSGHFGVAVLAMTVMIVSTTASAPTWIGITNTKAGITNAPVRPSHG